VPEGQVQRFQVAVDGRRRAAGGAHVRAIVGGSARAPVPGLLTDPSGQPAVNRPLAPPLVTPGTCNGFHLVSQLIERSRRSVRGREAIV
jgi:hypothetical protein